jgi:hypothetical protein
MLSRGFSRVESIYFGDFVLLLFYKLDRASTVVRALTKKKYEIICFVLYDNFNLSEQKNNLEARWGKLVHGRSLRII